jgi:hypothetical protein
MNEPTVHAQQTTGATTAKALLAVLKGCDSAGLHGRAATDRASYSDSFVFDVIATSKRKGVETRKEVSVPGWVSNGSDDTKETHKSLSGRPFDVYSGVFRPERGFWWLYAITDRVIDILDLLPSNAEIAFHVWLDGGTTETLIGTTLHADHLYMVATYTSRGKRIERRFMIDASTGQHNTARFGGR